MSTGATIGVAPGRPNWIDAPVTPVSVVVNVTTATVGIWADIVVVGVIVQATPPPEPATPPPAAPPRPADPLWPPAAPPPSPATPLPAPPALAPPELPLPAVVPAAPLPAVPLAGGAASI